MTEIKRVFKECLHCGKPFMAFKGLPTKVEDQPCPYCYLSKSGKKWNPEKREIE